ncbi:AAA domain (dynein-related subfamily) [Paenibacillus sp. yr247]|uniref:McrB family protein n=1 Tax=Paenibacillus sp. yr247 TaxID=1761880 RepID=UPI00088D7471|nr:AAA family ATPase [Paenibacillus sp. yr247]SDO87360.1 AAA domain (dynein-related subfamily) [Paenibacillus sp. yr247]
MINLTEYQQIFDIDNTTERCKKANDTMDGFWKAQFKNLAEEIIGQDYKIATYGKTLMTTYGDSLNPKYAEPTIETNTGRRYYVSIQQKIGGSDVNLLTLEFNGVEKQLFIYTELSFYQANELVRTDKSVLDGLDESIRIFARTSSFTKEEFERSILEQRLKDMIKPRNRPWIYFGIAKPLEGDVEITEIMGLLRRIWGQTESIRTYILEDKIRSARSRHIMDLIASVETPHTLTLIGQTYQIQYGHVEKEKSGVRKQSYTLKLEGQTIVHGAFFYSEYHESFGSPNPMLAVDVEQGNHIFTNIRTLLGEGTKEWWISKSFRMHNQNNEDLKQEAMNLLKQHDIHVRNGNEYYLATYDNQAQGFVEDVEKVKVDLVKAAILFAHVSGRSKMKLLDTHNEPQDTLPVEYGNGFVQEYNSNFNFSVIYESIQNCSLTFEKDLIRDLHLNLTVLDDKHFVILSGISGTGKTQLAKLYANAVYGLAYEAQNPYLSIIPVRPDWTDSTALFGYYSSFEKQYIAPEFLKVLLHAHEEREKPHFIVLDEMNLARVEYYLSDYLSGVESHKEIPLHNRTDLEGIPAKISIPPNVYLIGTINVDETTHSISDKVLDRAFVMTLSDVDLITFWDRMNEEVKTELHEEFDFLKKLHSCLAPYHLHFGYRTMNEMIQKMCRHLELDIEHQAPRHVLLDKVISEKVLPKLRGDDQIGELLKKLKDEFKAHLGEHSTSFGHMERMERELTRYGATQFWR